MNTKTFTITTPQSAEEIITKIGSVTVSDYSQTYKQHGTAYYGEVTHRNFDIKNMRYSPMSSAPNIQGEVQEQTNRTIVKLDIDIKSNYHLMRNMYYSTLLPIGILVLIACIFVLGDTEYWLQGYIFSGAFIACGFVVPLIEKISLAGMKKNEIKKISSIINGKIIST